jgi:hypothetical protein
MNALVQIMLQINSKAANENVKRKFVWVTGFGISWHHLLRRTLLRLSFMATT